MELSFIMNGIAGGDGVKFGVDVFEQPDVLPLSDNQDSSLRQESIWDDASQTQYENGLS